MDAERFDRITKALVAGTSRRRVVSGLAALGLGGVLAPAPAGAQLPIEPVDSGGPTAAATDQSCAGKKAFNNKRCEAARCGGNNCFCGSTVNGDKRCVDAGAVRCPGKDQCDSDAQCGRNKVCLKVGGCCGSRKNLCAPLC
jgi:hypothetical protein